MIQKIVHTATGLTLIGAGPVNRDQIDLALRNAPFLIAADGGLRSALQAGHLPMAVVGDFDSVSPDDLARIPVENRYKIDDQNSTDFEKCLAGVSAPFIIALGVTGGRLDHTLAAMNAVVKTLDTPVILLDAEDICFLCPPRLVLELPVGTRLSLFPMGRVTGTSRGLQYPIDGLDFTPDGKIGTSNATDAGQVTLTFEMPCMLVLLPKLHLTAAIAALLQA